MKLKPLDPEVLRYWQGYFDALSSAAYRVGTLPAEFEGVRLDACRAIDRLVGLFVDEADKQRRMAKKRKA